MTASCQYDIGLIRALSSSDCPAFYQEEWNGHQRKCYVTSRSCHDSNMSVRRSRWYGRSPPLTGIHRYPGAALCKSPLMILETQQENNFGKIFDKLTNYLLWLLHREAINHILAKLVIMSPTATWTLSLWHFSLVNHIFTYLRDNIW